MRPRTMALAGVAVAGVTAFFFLAPVFYWFAYVAPTVEAGGPPLFTAYHSAGCEYLGLGVAYYTTKGVVISCDVSKAPFIPTVMEPSGFQG